MLVTLGAKGMASESAAVPALLVEVYDEAGAGDTVISTIALAVGAGKFDKTALALAAQMAACVVQKVGVAVPSQEDIARIATLT
jgi:D-beta-D-heptose 7-phosphate kinase/D-beta-D-heptose 1-phosphate adenosyltransferase